MKIRVEVKNELLGDSVFWEGDSDDINLIKNYPARDLARRVAVDGKTRKYKMWHISQVKELCECGNESEGLCEACGEPVCEECQAPMKGSPNPLIDYPLHESCMEDY
jgi:hypothetical protein